VEGGFCPGGVHREWCDNEVLRTIRRKSLARLRKEVEPVEQRTLVRLLTRWQGVVQPRRGLDALLDVIENLQGAPLPASILETEILPARLVGYKPSDLDILIAAGEVVWVGLEPIGERDGRIGLYLAEKLPELWNAGNTNQASALSERAEKILAYLRVRGASFFQELHDGVGGGYPGETLIANVRPRARASSGACINRPDFVRGGRLRQRHREGGPCRVQRSQLSYQRFLGRPQRGAMLSLSSC
jgi:ATP-dependent Lhr-like helicase